MDLKLVDNASHLFDRALSKRIFCSNYNQAFETFALKFQEHPTSSIRLTIDMSLQQIRRNIMHACMQVPIIRKPFML